jgi:cytochrome P450
LIKILSKYDYKDLVSRKYFYSNGIKHLERLCRQDIVISGKKIKMGDRVRLFVESYEFANLTESEKNKKFFAAGTSHSCIGMNYSMHVWKELIGLLKKNFTNITLLDWSYRSNDAIFKFPIIINVEYLKCK